MLDCLSQKKKKHKQTPFRSVEILQQDGHIPLPLGKKQHFSKFKLMAAFSRDHPVENAFMVDAPGRRAGSFCKASGFRVWVMRASQKIYIIEK